MYSPPHLPCQQHEEDERGDEETLTKPQNADYQIPQIPQSPESTIHQNPQDSGLLSPSNTPFPLPPISIDYPPAITDTHVVMKHSEPPLTSPSGGAVLFEEWFYDKRHKVKPNSWKQNSIIKRYRTLLVGLNPIPFHPPKILCFTKHEALLRRLGLWGFVQVEFDSKVRVDLISQLVASYDPFLKCSYVKGTRVAVNMVNLAQAFKLTVKKGTGNVVGDGAVLSEEGKESMVFMEQFLSNWVLLHGDAWMMPTEVLNWTRMIKDGHLENVDWASLLWFMVDKELRQGEQLRDCYYASHLQHLIKSQHKEVFLGETQKLESYVEVKDVESKGNNDDVKLGSVGVVQEGKGVPIEGPNFELSLGQDGGRKEGKVRDGEMRDVEEGKIDVGRNHDTSDGDGLIGNVLQLDEMDFTSQSNEIQRLDEIAHNEIQRRDEEISRLQREIDVMGSLLVGYREALMEINNSFSQYRQRVRNSEQPGYREVAKSEQQSTENPESPANA